MDWFKKHVDTVIIMSGILSSFLWVNNKLNNLEKEVVIIKTVLIMKNIMPKDLACEKKDKIK